MKLDSLLKSAKYIDEQVLRYYSRLTKEWEKKGRSRYLLGHMFNGSALASLLASNFLHGGFNPYCLTGFLHGNEAASLVAGQSEKPNIEGETTALNPYPHLMDKFSKFVRLPVLVGGITHAGIGIFSLVDYIKTNNPDSLNSAMYNLAAGYSFIGNASSRYVRHSDPKLLKKDPFYKTAYNWARKTLEKAIPQPIPEPVPVPVPGNYDYLEDKFFK